MQKHISDVIRPLGALEHLLWLLDQAHPIHMVFTAEIDGTAGTEQWRAALDRVQERHPLLSARAVLGPGRLPQFRRVEGARIPLRVVEADPRSAWQDEVYREFTTPFEHDSVPLLRAVLIQGEDRTALILNAHHTLTDGMGLCFLIRDTLAAVSGETLEPLPLSPSMDALLGIEEAPEQGPDPEPLPPPKRAPAWPQMQALRIDPDLTARIKERCRQEGATVHAALMAAAVVAGRDMSPAWREGQVRFLSPINHRKPLGVGEDCGVYATGASTAFQPELFESAQFWDLARHASESLAPFRSGEGAGPAVAGLRQFTATGPDVAKAAGFASTALAREAVLTNHGELPFGTRYGNLTLDAIWTAILSSFAEEQVIVVSTLNGAICLTHGARTPFPGLLDKMREVLLRETA